jgi:hypothetical protein
LLSHPFKGFALQAEVVAVEVKAFADDAGFVDTTALIEGDASEVHGGFDALAKGGRDRGDFLGAVGATGMEEEFDESAGEQLLNGFAGVTVILRGEVGDLGKVGAVSKSAGIAVEGGVGDAILGEFELHPDALKGGRDAVDDGEVELASEVGRELVEERGLIVVVGSMGRGHELVPPRIFLPPRKAEKRREKVKTGAGMDRIHKINRVRITGINSPWAQDPLEAAAALALPQGDLAILT